MADRIVVMSKGRIEQLGTPLEIYNRPATPIRRRLLRHADHEFRRGHGRATAAGGASVARASSSRCPMRCPPTSPAARSCSACAPSTCLSATVPRQGTVQLTEPLGDVTLVHFDYGQAIPLVAKAGPTTTLQPGSGLSFSFATDYCHLFGADGVRLY